MMGTAFCRAHLSPCDKRPPYTAPPVELPLSRAPLTLRGKDREVFPRSTGLFVRSNHSTRWALIGYHKQSCVSTKNERRQEEGGLQPGVTKDPERLKHRLRSNSFPKHLRDLTAVGAKEDSNKANHPGSSTGVMRETHPSFLLMP